MANLKDLIVNGKARAVGGFIGDLDGTANKATNDVDGNPIKTTYLKVADKPVVNNATLTIQKNGTNVATFTANASSNVTANIAVPTVTDTYSSTSSDGMSGKAVASAIANKVDNTTVINGAALSNATSYFYGTSDTAAATTEKEVSIPSVTTLSAGTVIVIKPTVTSTVANSTIKLNSFTAYPMRYKGSAITTSTDSIVWPANVPTIWVFDGDYWHFAGRGSDDNTTYSNMSVSEGTTGTATSQRTMRADYLKQIIQGTVLTGLDTSSATAIDSTDTVLSGLGKLQAQVSTKADSATTIAGYGITDAYTKTEIDGMVSAGMHYKGTVASYSNLPASGNQIGDLYNVTDSGANYAWNGTDWDKLSENIDLSGLASKAEAAGSLSGSNATLTLKNVNGGTLSTVTVNNVANATNATKATQDASGNVITTTYSTKAETVTGVSGSGATVTVTKNGTDSTFTINNVANATKATQDASGNVITTTYSTKAETVTGVVAGSTADKIDVTKNGTTSTITVNNVAKATRAAEIDTEAASSNVNRPVFFAYNNNNNKVTYDNDFQYNPSTNVLTVGSITGNAATATKATNDSSDRKITDTYQYWVKKTIDLSDTETYLDTTWYPVTGTSMYGADMRRILVDVELNSGTKPSWSTHNSGFSVILDMFAIGSGWGTTSAQSVCLQQSASWVTDSSTPPASFSQMTNSSTPVLWLRGGGKYFVWTNYACTWTPRTETYTASNQSVTPTTTYPALSFNRSKIWANLNGTADYASEASLVNKTVSADSTGNLVYAKMGTNDYFRITVGGAANAGYAELATADDGNEPIYVRQYTGTFTTLKRTLTLLDADGNSNFPGVVTAVGFSGPLTGNVTGNVTGNLTGTASKATADADGNTISSTYIKYTSTSGVNVVGNTKTVAKTNPETLYVPNGLIMGGTAAAAGLVTRGICGSSEPTSTGAATKDNLYLNYDSTNNYSASRQVVIQAGTVGTHYGNNLYQYCAARGDAVKNYADATYLKIADAPVVNNATLTVQADGTSKGTFTANASSNATINIQKSDFYPTKTYTGLIATSNEWKNAALYLLTVRPTSWNKEWAVKYKLEATLDDGITPTNYQYFNSQHECYLTGRQGVYTAYANFNSIASTDYRTIYYHVHQRTTEAGYNAGNGHKIGIDLTSSKEPTNTNYKRTIKITILDYENCTVTFNEAPEIPSNSTRTDYTKLNSTYYTTTEANSAGNWSRLNGYTNGLQETGDNNDNTTDVTNLNNYYLTNGSKNNSTSLKIFGYNLIGFSKDGKALCISVPTSAATENTTAIQTARVYNTVGFEPSKGLLYTNTATVFAADGNINITARRFTGSVDIRYSDNCVATSTANDLGLVVRKPIYLRGTIGDDGLFYLAPLSVTYNNTTYQRAWVQDLPNTEDGYVYWFVGYPYYNKSYPNSLYQLDLNASNYVIHFKNGKYQVYVPINSGAISGSFTTSNWTSSSGKYVYSISVTGEHANANVLFYDSNNQQVFPEEVQLTKSNGNITSITATVGSDPDCRFAGTYSIFY